MVCTCWTPLGDIPPEMGPLAICLRSHTWPRLRETYGRSDVDRDLIPGHFSENPAELVEKFGGRWATAAMVDSKSSWVESMKSYFLRISCGINAGHSA